MIAEAAYFRALARRFQGGDPMDDWLAAEAEINRLLPTPAQQKEEQAAYEQLRAEVQRVWRQFVNRLMQEQFRMPLSRVLYI